MSSWLKELLKVSRIDLALKTQEAGLTMSEILKRRQWSNATTF